MIKTDFSQTPNAKNSVTQFFALNTLLYGFNFGLLGGMANAFLNISFFGNFCLLFGQIFVLFCLVTKGLNAAIIAAMMSATSAAVFSNDPYMLVILLLEMLFVHVAMRKGYFLFQSAMTYWLLIGAPIYVVLHALTSFASPELLFIGSITRVFNGLICVSVVAICCWFLPSHYIYAKYYTRPPRLASLIFSLCMLTITLPAMVLSLLFIWQATNNNKFEISQNLKDTATQVAAANNIEIKRHLDSLQTIATVIESDPTAEIYPLLNATAENYQLFDSIVLSDRNGQILDAAPISYHQKLNDVRHLNIHYQSFFKQASLSTEPFILSTGLGDFFGNKLTLCFVAPIRYNGRFQGLVKGAMTLQSLSSHNQKLVGDDYQFIISDANNRIIAKSGSIEAPVLSNFDYTEYDDPLISNVPSLMFYQQQYLYQQYTNEYRWTITVMQSPQSVISMLVRYFLILVVATTVILTAFAVIARTLSNRITKPLVDIAENFPNTELHPRIIRESQVSSEMVKLTHKLIDSHEVMSNFHQQLSKQVNDKTKQLKQLNRELYSIAQKDSLTQLLNRAGFNRLAITSYRNCIRNHIKMSIILIDIDHFKRINDTHGHPFGDKCIVAVAKTIQKHCKRDTDVIGRYGGEEFIVMIVGGEIEEHKQRIALVKDEIQKLVLKKDGHDVSMTISAGICSVSSDFSTDYEDLLQLADNQLYLSKREGRNRISTVLR